MNRKWQLAVSARADVSRILPQHFGTHRTSSGVRDAILRGSLAAIGSNQVVSGYERGPNTPTHEDVGSDRNDARWSDAFLFAASILNRRSQSLDRLVPLRGSAGQVVSGIRDRIGPDRKPALPANTLARNHPSLFEYMQMLGDALARQFETIRELRDRVLLPVTEARNKLKAGPVAKSRKHRGRLNRVASVGHGRQCSWPGCPNLPYSSAALPTALIPGTVENPFQ